MQLDTCSYYKFLPYPQKTFPTVESKINAMMFIATMYILDNFSKLKNIAKTSE